jgi:hypothetical protein
MYYVLVSFSFPKAALLIRPYLRSMGRRRYILSGLVFVHSVRNEDPQNHENLNNFEMMRWIVCKADKHLLAGVLNTHGVEQSGE